MGRKDDIFQRQQRAVGPRRLVGKSVYGRSRHGTVLQGASQGAFVDDAAAGEIDDKRSRPQQGEPPLCFPGEIEHRTQAKRLAEGVPVPAAIRQTLDGLAKRYGVALLP